MPKKLNCPSCGANLKPDAYYCDYCGAFFEKQKNSLNEQALKRFSPKETIAENKEENLHQEEQFISTEEIENSRLNSILIAYNQTRETGMITGVLFILLFLFIFSVGAFIEIPFAAIIIVIVLANTINSQKEKKQELIKLYEKSAYEKAYLKLNEMTLSKESINILKQKILLCYYRLNKKDEVVNLINSLNLKPHIKDEHIKEVAQKLNVIYEPKQNFNL